MNKRTFPRIYGFFTLIIYVLCISAFVYLRRELVPELGETTGFINALSIFIIAAYIVTGIYHIVLLASGLRNLKGRFINSIYLSLVIISGIMLLSDAAQLSDIGKEYLYFDITSQWGILLGFAVFHLIIIIAGLAVSWNNVTDSKLFSPAGDNWELYSSIHQVGLTTGILGIAGTVTVNTGLIVPERYTVQFMVLTAALAMAPVLLFALYWVLKLRKRPVGEWLDEMQFRRSAAAAIISLAVSVPVYILAVVSQVFRIMDYGAAFWMLLLAFIQITAYSIAVLAKRG